MEEVIMALEDQRVAAMLQMDSKYIFFKYAISLSEYSRATFSHIIIFNLTEGSRKKVEELQWEMGRGSDLQMIPIWMMKMTIRANLFRIYSYFWV